MGAVLGVIVMPFKILWCTAVLIYDILNFAILLLLISLGIWIAVLVVNFVTRNVDNFLHDGEDCG